MELLINLLISALGVFITAQLLPGVSVSSFGTAVLVAIVLGLLNAVIKPLLLILTLPLTIITLGLFTFIINAVLILIASSFVQGFHVDGLLTALLFSLVLSVINSVLSTLTK